MIAWSRRSRRLDFVPAGRVPLQVETVGETAIEILEIGIRNEGHFRRDVSWTGGRAAGVLVYDGNGVMIPAVSVPAAELYALGRAGEREAVIDILGGGAKVGLIVNVPPAQVPAARWAEGQIEFELPDAHAQGVLRQLEKAANSNELQISIAQSHISAGTADANVVIPPEGDVTTEISGHEDTEQSRLEVGPGNERSRCARRQLRVEVISIITEDRKSTRLNS